MLQRGVMLHHLSGFGLPECVRVTTGTKEENSIFFDQIFLGSYNLFYESVGNYNLVNFVLCSYYIYSILADSISVFLYSMKDIYRTK